MRHEASRIGQGKYGGAGVCVCRNLEAYFSCAGTVAFVAISRHLSLCNLVCFKYIQEQAHRAFSAGAVYRV